MRIWLSNNSDEPFWLRTFGRKSKKRGSDIVNSLFAVIICTAIAAGVANAASTAPKQASGNLSEAQQFCVNIADVAADTRYALQRRELKQLQADISDRLKVLNERIAEYKVWMAKRKKFSEMAKAKLVAIYTKMRTEAASEQISLMDNLVAASLIARLPAKQASTILGEMDAKKAATIADTVRYAGEIKKRSAPKK